LLRQLLTFGPQQWLEFGVKLGVKKNSLIFVISWIFASSNAILKSFLLLPYVFTPVMFIKILCMYLNRRRHSLYRCSFKFPVRVGVEESIVNALRISFSCLNLTVVCVFIRVVPGAFTIDSLNANLDRKFK
jgi:hypothetical protein